MCFWTGVNRLNQTLGAMQKHVQVPGEDRRAAERRSGEERRRMGENRLQRVRSRAINQSDRRLGEERRGADGPGVFALLRHRWRRWRLNTPDEASG